MREERAKGDRSLIKLPEEYKEYLAIYTTEYEWEKRHRMQKQQEQQRKPPDNTVSWESFLYDYI